MSPEELHEVERYLEARIRFIRAALGPTMHINDDLRRLLHEQPWGIFTLPLSGEDSFSNEYGRAVSGADVQPSANDWADRFTYLSVSGEPIPMEELPSVIALSGAAPPMQLIRIHDNVNNRHVDLYAIARAHFDSDGQVIGSVAVSIAVAEWGADRSWASHTSLHMLLRQTPNAIAIVDCTGRVLACSDAWRALPEVGDGNPVGRNIDDMLPESEPGWPDRWAAVLRGETVVEDSVLMPDPTTGDRRYMQLRYMPWRTGFGDIGGGVLYRRDVTAERLATHKLQHANRTLRRQNDALEQFAYAASHDLQEPLRAMRQFAELLDRRYGSTLDERGSRYLGHIIDGASRISDMVDGLLAFARAGESVMLEPVCLADSLARVTPDLMPRLADCGGTLTFETDLPTVLGTPTTIDSALRNVLTNAIKYRSDARALTVHIRTEREEGDTLLFVEDNGRGFAPEHNERLFRLFRRLDNVDGVEGFGIGLAVVRRQLDAIGATIEAVSAVEKGTNIVIRLRSSPG